MALKTRVRGHSVGAWLGVLLALGSGAVAARAQSADLTGLGYDLGDPKAKISVIEFGDFGCSACALFSQKTFADFNREFIASGRVRWKFIPFILGSFPNSGAATRAAECAAEQNAFWSMHDLLYGKQREWNKALNPRPKFEAFAKQLNLDLKQYRACVEQDRPAQRVERNNHMAASLLVRQTPTFFVNGRRAVGALPIDQWRQIVEMVASGR